MTTSAGLRVRGSRTGRMASSLRVRLGLLVLCSVLLPAGVDLAPVSAAQAAAVSPGMIAGWGVDTYGQASPPAGNNYTAVAAGVVHSVALRADGSIVAWGDNTFGEATAPPGNDFIAIAATDTSNLALRADSSIVGWGDNNSGQVTSPPGSNYTAIAIGAAHSLALRADGSITAWGAEVFGEATAPPGSNYTAIAAGANHSVALRSDGSILAWGSNEFGVSTPPPGNNYTAIAAGYRHNLALRSDGSIVRWGDNTFGQATPPPGNNFVAIAAGRDSSLALRADGTVVGFGIISDPPMAAIYTAIATGGSHALALWSEPQPQPPGPPADTTPPETTITKGAPNRTDKTSVKFRFRSNEPEPRFACKLDKNDWKLCTSPKKLKGLDYGKHKFQVKAIDRAGHVDPTPGKDKFKVVKPTR